jgi:hypothetical protein
MTLRTLLIFAGGFGPSLFAHGCHAVPAGTRGSPDFGADG